MVDLQSPSFLVHTPLISFFLPSTTTVLVTSKKSFIDDVLRDCIGLVWEKRKIDILRENVWSRDISYKSILHDIVKNNHTTVYWVMI